MKKIIIALVAIVMVVCSFTLIACSNKDADIITNYIFEQDGQMVDSDFVLPLTISGKKAEWKSNSDYVTLSKLDEEWRAVVSYPETGIETVTLTLTIGKVSKDFTVRVKAIDEITFMDNYVFKYDKGTVASNFDLERSFTFKDKTCSISWSVSEDYNLYLAISEDGNSCIVYEQASITPVQITATFVYNGVPATKSYSLNVYKEMVGLELVDYWYNNTGVSIKMSGYVVEIGTAYSSSYNSVTLYIVNDDYTAGYYLFRVKTTDEYGKVLKVGDHVTVTGTTNTNYNGLIETNAGGSLVIDTDWKVPYEASKAVAAVDDLVIGNLPATIYNESRLVSLTNWKVLYHLKDKENGDAYKTTDDNYTLMMLTKGGVNVAVRVSKYLEGAYTKGDATHQALVSLLDTYAVGSTVNVKGIFSCYRGTWQIMPLSASDVTAGGEADLDTKNDYDGNKVAAAVSAVNAKIAELGLNKDITSNKEVQLLTESNGVSISYNVRKSNSVTIDKDGKMVVTPGNPETTSIQVKYSINGFETVQFVYVYSLIPSAASIIEGIKLPDSISGEYKLPTYEGAELVWEIESGDEDSLKIEGGKLIPTIGRDKITYILRLTLTYEEKEKVKEYVVILDSIYSTLAGEGTEEKPYSVEDINSIISVSGQSDSDKDIYIKGYIASLSDFDAEKKNYSNASIGDAANDANAVAAATFAGIEGAEHEVGDCVVVLATLKYDADANAWVLSDAKVVKVISKISDGVPTIVKATAPFEENKGYYLTIDQTNLSKTIFVKNEIANSFYLGSSEEYTSADLVYLKSVEGGYNLYFKSADDKITYISGAVSGTYVNLKLVDKDPIVWSYNAEHNCFTHKFTVDGEEVEYYIGTYNTYTTFSLCKISKISTSFPAYLTYLDYVQPAAKGESVETAYTADELWAEFGSWESGKVSEKQVYVKGMIVKEPSYNSDYGSYTFYFASSKDGKQVQGYSAKLGDGVSSIGIYDEIVVYGYLTMYAKADGSYSILEVAYLKATGVSPVVVSVVAHECSDADEDGKCDLCEKDIEGEEPVVPVAPEFDHAGTAEDPYSIADVNKMFDAEYTELKNFYVKAFVISMSSWSDDQGNYTYAYLADTADGNGKVSVYIFKGDLITTVEVGNQVICTVEYVSQFNGTWQINKVVISEILEDEGGDENEDGGVTYSNGNDSITIYDYWLSYVNYDAYVEEHNLSYTVDDNGTYSFYYNRGNVTCTFTISDGVLSLTDSENGTLTLYINGQGGSDEGEKLEKGEKLGEIELEAGASGQEWSAISSGSVIFEFTITSQDGIAIYDEDGWNDMVNDMPIATLYSSGVVEGLVKGATYYLCSSESFDLVVTVYAVAAEEGGEEQPAKGTTAETAYTVDELWDAFGSLEHQEASEEQYYVKGVISSVPSFNGYGYAFDFVNSKNASIQGYSVKLGDVATTICQNDEVVIYGYIYKYNSTLEVAYVSSLGVNPQLISRVAGNSTVSFVENENADITVSVENGVNGSEFSITVSSKNGAVIDAVQVNGFAVTANEDGSYTGVIAGNTVVTVDARIPVEGPVTSTVDFSTKFANFGWDSSYKARSLSSSDLGISGVSLTVDFTNANKQEKTINDIPVVAAKNSAQYVTVSVSGVSISSISFDLREWSTDKKFTTVTIEYTTDGLTWVATNLGVVNGTASAISSVGTTLAYEDLPENVSAVRLVFVGSNSRNNQVGIEGFTIVTE